MTIKLKSIVVRPVNIVHDMSVYIYMYIAIKRRWKQFELTVIYEVTWHSMAIHGVKICKRFTRHWPFVEKYPRSSVDSLTKGQWCAAFMFSWSLTEQLVEYTVNCRWFRTPWRLCPVWWKWFYSRHASPRLRNIHNFSSYPQLQRKMITDNNLCSETYSSTKLTISHRPFGRMSRVYWKLFEIIEGRTLRSKYFQFVDRSAAADDQPWSKSICHSKISADSVLIMYGFHIRASPASGDSLSPSGPYMRR